MTPDRASDPIAGVGAPCPPLRPADPAAVDKIRNLLCAAGFLDTPAVQV